MTDYLAYTKKRKEFGQKPEFGDTETKVIGFLPQTRGEDLGPNHVRRDPSFITIDNIPEMSEHVVNTERVTTFDRGMYHQEGGWPSGMDPTDPQMTTKWKKKIEKDTAFTGAVKGLCDTIEECISQNNQIDLFEEYFYNEEPEHFVESLSTKTLILFKDPEGANIKRSVGKISWYPENPTKLAVSYAIMRFQQMPEGMPTQSYIWDVNNPNTPDITLASPSPITSIAFNHKNTDHIAGGCYNGLICYWDARQRERGGLALQARAQAPIEKSHYDPVVDLVWLSSKTGSEFVTTSTDGKMLWWDTRKLDEPTDWTELDEGPLGPDGKVRVVGGTGIEYVPDAGPTKYLVGTEQGSILTVNKRPKKKVEIGAKYGIDSGRHYGPITAIQRNPFHTKYFMTVGDWSVKIWNEDANLKTPIIRTRYHNAYLSDGTWSPSRPGVFFVTRRDGWMDVWDYFYRQNEIAFSHKVSDTALTCIKINTTGGGNQNIVGKFAAIGDQHGTVTLLELCDSLYMTGSDNKEKEIIGDILDRETRKEKNLEFMKKQAEGKQKVQREGKAFKEWESKKSDVIKKTEEAFFAAMGKQEEHQGESERSGLEDSYVDRREKVAEEEEERQEEQQEQQHEAEAEDHGEGEEEGEPADVQAENQHQEQQEPQGENPPQGEQPEATNANNEAGGEAQAESQ